MEKKAELDTQADVDAAVNRAIRHAENGCLHDIIKLLSEVLTAAGGVGFVVGLLDKFAHLGVAINIKMGEGTLGFGENEFLFFGAFILVTGLLMHQAIKDPIFNSSDSSDSKYNLLD